MPRRGVLAVLALVAVCAVWGTTFVIVKEAIRQIPPFEFLAIRFAIAALVLVILFPRQVARTKAPTLQAGALAGVALAAGYGFQTTGLQYTTATNAGFLTGLYVIFAPLLGTLLLLKLPSRTEWIAVAIALAGLALLTLGPSLRLTRGDGLIVLCAVSFAVHIVLLGRVSPLYDARQLASMQLATGAVLFALISGFGERPIAPAGAGVWFALLLTSIAASALAFLAQTWAQSHLDPTQTAVTLTMEPVFAGLAGFVLLDERLDAAGWAGAVLIFGAMLLVARARPRLP